MAYHTLPKSEQLSYFKINNILKKLGIEVTFTKSSTLKISLNVAAIRTNF